MMNDIKVPYCKIDGVKYQLYWKGDVLRFPDDGRSDQYDLNLMVVHYIQGKIPLSDLFEYYTNTGCSYDLVFGNFSTNGMNNHMVTQGKEPTKKFALYLGKSRPEHKKETRKKVDKPYYSANVNWVPYTKQQLDAMGFDGVRESRRQVIMLSDWSLAKSDGVEEELKQYCDELFEYESLREPFDEMFDRWKKSTDPMAKFLVKIGYDRLLSSRIEEFKKTLPTFRFIKGLTYEEYNK